MYLTQYSSIMAITAKVALLVLGLVVACSAGVSRHQAADTIGPFKKNVLLGRGLAAQKRGQYNTGCSLEVCWDAFYSQAFKDLPTCNTALAALKSCVESGLTSQDLCKCKYHQVEEFMKIDDDSCSTMHSTLGFGQCAESSAQACLDKMSTINRNMYMNLPMSVEDKKVIYNEVKQCLEDADQGRLDTTGCSIMFPQGNILEMMIMSAKAWSEGCSLNNVGILCPSPIPENLGHCSAQNDIVGTFIECAKKELTEASCQHVLPDIVDLLNKYKVTKCSKVNKVHKIIEQTCSVEGRKRTLFKRLLDLLEAQKK